MITEFQKENQSAPCYVASPLYQKYLSNPDKRLLLVTTSASLVRLEGGIAKTKELAYFLEWEKY